MKEVYYLIYMRIWRKIKNVVYSFKAKLIFGFVLITLIMSAVSIGSFISSRSAVAKLSEMVDITTATNSIRTSALNISYKIQDFPLIKALKTSKKSLMKSAAWSANYKG